MARKAGFQTNPGRHKGGGVPGAAVVVGAPVVAGTVVVGATVVVGLAVVVVTDGEAAAWAGTITDWTTGRIHDLGSRPSATPVPAPAPIAFKSGRRLISSSTWNPQSQPVQPLYDGRSDRSNPAGGRRT